MQAELETISEKMPLVEQWSHQFGAFLEPILPEKCTTILETIRDLQRVFTVIRPSLREKTLLIVPLLSAVDHGEKLAVQLAGYQTVCRSPNMKYLQQRQNIAVLLSQLAKKMEDVLMKAGYQPTTPVPTTTKLQRTRLHMVSSQEEE